MIDKDLWQNDRSFLKQNQPQRALDDHPFGNLLGPIQGGSYND